MPGLLDFLQSASNAVAGNVSGPVDLIAWALRKAGVPVGENPVGGSAWLARQGLTRQVPQSAASLLGETAGLLGPVVAAAKAPQIANGLLTMGENAAAPRMLNPQTGAIVYHGSPHKFDKFDSSKIGTGEGAQAYGHGLYLAENAKVADEYAGKLSAKSVGIDGYKPTGEAQKILDRLSARANTTQYGSALSAVWDDLQSILRHGSPAEQAAAKEIEQRAGFLGTKLRVFDAGNLYKVDLPDEAIARMLDWDKPLSQQSKSVREAFEPLAAPIRKIEAGSSGAEWGDLAFSRSYDPTGAEIRSLLQKNNSNRMTAQDFLTGGHGPDVSEALRRMGIPGIRYLDGGSRGAGSGTSNYVVFPGEEGLLKILERNGVPLP